MSQHPASEPSVLVVEDDPTLAEVYADWLREVCAVRTAYGGEDALERLDPSLDVVLLDRRMPDVSGDEVLAEIRSRDYDCRVGMVTAIDADVDVAALDCDVYLTKPVTEADLYDAVDRLLRRTTYPDDVRRYFSLASRKAAMETGMAPDRLDESEEYAALTEELDAIRERIEPPEE